MRFLLTVYEPLDSATNVNAPQQIGAGMWLDDSQTSFHVITQLGAGFYTCQVGLPSSETMGAANPEAQRYGQQLGVPAVGWLPQPVSGLRQRAHIVIQAGSFTIFEGRVTTIFPGPGGWPSGFLATGYGVSATNDDVFNNYSPYLTTNGVFLGKVLGQIAPLIVPGPSDLFVDPGVTTQELNFVNMYPSQIISQFSKAGAGGTFWDFMVWENRVASFLPRLAPGVPDYLVPWDSRVQQAQIISDRMADTVKLQYSKINPDSANTTATETQTNSNFVSQNGWSHTEYISGGQLYADAASAYVAALLDLFAKPEFSATIIRNSAPLRDDALMPSSMGVETWSGQMRPPWMVRCGQNLQIDIEPSSQDNIAVAGPHIIQRTEWVSNGQLTITVGTPIQDWVAVLATIGDNLQDVRNKINPNTGGPA